jgi:glycosyltransferase involved in cell wall biosynthesis
MPVPFEEVERQSGLARLGIEPHHSVVSFAGSWGATQDFAPVIAAAKCLSDVRFVLAGEGSERADMRSTFERLPNVSLPGWLGAKELAILLSATDVGLLPYRSDAPQTLPNKLFEYMAYGAFQIGTLRGEAEAIYERTGAGRTVAPGGDALVTALRDYFASPARAERTDRIAWFRTLYAGTAVYGDMVAQIEAIAGR